MAEPNRRAVTVGATDFMIGGAVARLLHFGRVGSVGQAPRLTTAAAIAAQQQRNRPHSIRFEEP